jgi:hypothetical protein
MANGPGVGDGPPIGVQSEKSNVIPLRPRTTAPERQAATARDTETPQEDLVGAKTITKKEEPTTSDSSRGPFRRTFARFRENASSSTDRVFEYVGLPDIASFDDLVSFASRHPTFPMHVTTAISELPSGDFLISNKYDILEEEHVAATLSEQAESPGGARDIDHNLLTAQITKTALGRLKQFPNERLTYTKAGKGGKTYRLWDDRDREALEEFSQRIDEIVAAGAPLSIKTDDDTAETTLPNSSNEVLRLPQEVSLLTDFRKLKAFINHYSPERINVITQEIVTDSSTSQKEDKSDIGSKQIATIITTRDSIPEQGKQKEAKYIQIYKDGNGQPVYTDGMDQEALAKHARSCVHTALGATEELKEAFMSVITYKENVINDGNDRGDTTQIKTTRVELASAGATSYNYTGKSFAFPGFE